MQICFPKNGETDLEFGKEDLREIDFALITLTRNSALYRDECRVFRGKHIAIASFQLVGLGKLEMQVDIVAQPFMAGILEAERGTSSAAASLIAPLDQIEVEFAWCDGNGLVEAAVFDLACDCLPVADDAIAWRGEFFVIF